MKTKYITKYVITVIFVIAWLRIAYINRMIVVEPIQKYLVKEYTFEQARDAIVANYPANLEEKYKFINLNGLFVKVSGGRTCNNIIKLKNGSLTTVSLPYLQSFC